MDYTKHYNLLVKNLEHRERVFNNIGGNYGSAGIIKLSKIEQINFPEVHGLTGGTHPSVEYFPDGFGGYKYWMAYTPYPGEQNENPVIVCSMDGYTWRTPTGLTNPIDPTPSNGYNNDTELVFDGDKLYCYWRTYYYNEEIKSLYRMESEDGKVWTNKTECTFDVYHDPISPSIVRDWNGNYQMWIGAYSNNKIRRYESSNGIDFVFKEECPSNYDDFGNHWHPSIWVEGNKYRCLSAFTPKYFQPNRSESPIRKTILLYGTSDDGTNWKFDSLPFISPLVDGEKSVRIYRSCCIFDGNKHMVFLSGRGAESEQIHVFEAKLVDH